MGVRHDRHSIRSRAGRQTETDRPGIDHRLTSLAAESRCKLWHIGDDAIDAIFAGRMRIGDCVGTEVFRTLILAGPLRVADKEALIRREPVFVSEVHVGGLPLPREVCEKSAAKADGFLNQGGVILRSVAAYGLPECLRMTIGTQEQNRLAVSLLQKFMAG